MFDVDKMYIMFPKIVPQYNLSDKIFNYVRTNLKGKTKEETIDNINKVIDQINPDYDESFNVDDFAEEILNISNVSDTQDLEKQLYKDTVNLFINVLRKTKKQSPLLKDIKDQTDFDTVESLKYDVRDLGNKLIELYKSVLTHPEVYSSVMKPIDIDFIEKEIKDIFPDKSNIFMNHFDPEVDTKLRYSLLGGKAGVGQEANAMVDISRPGKLVLNDVKDILWGHHNIEGESIFDLEFSEKLSEEDLNYYVNELVDKNADSERIKEFKNELRKVKTIDSLTAILNAFVDIAKDPYISKGNWTTSTTNVGNLLLRLGAHPLYVVNFLANDVITQYVEFQKSKEGLTENEPGDLMESFKAELVINNLNNYAKKQGFKLDLGAIYDKQFNKLNVEERKEKLKYRLDKGYINQQQYDEELVSIDKELKDSLNILNKKLKLETDDLEKVRKDIISINNSVFDAKPLNIFDRNTLQYNKFKLNLKYFRNQNKIKNKNEDSLMFEVNLLKTFKDLVEYSKNLGETVRLSKIDTDGFGKDHNSLFGIFNLYEQVIDKEIDQVKGSIRGFNTKLNNTTLGVYWNQLEWVKNLVEANPLLFPSGMSQAKNMFNEISNDLYGTNAIDAELLTDLSKHYNSYLMSKFFNLSKEESQDLLDNLPKRIKEYKDIIGEKYFMLNEMNIKTYKNNKYSDSIQLGNRKKSKSYDRSFTNSWKDLFIDNPKLAEDLVKYGFITSGFQMNTNQFFTFIPSEYFNQNDINRKIQDITEEINNEQLNDFVDKFYLNNLTNKKYVKKIKDSLIYTFTKNLKSEQDFTNDFIMKEPGKSRKYVELRIPSKLGADPLANIPKQYYKLVGYNELKQGVYQRIEDVINKLNDRSLITYSDYVDVKTTIKPDLDVQSPQIEDFVPTDSVDNLYEDVNMEEFLNSMQYGSEPMIVSEVTPIVEIQQLSLFDNIQESKTMNSLKEMFEQSLMLNKFNESGVNNVDDLSKLSEDELAELLKKICK